MNKQRRHIRLKTRQTARARFPGQPSFPCEIVEFCQAGLYLRLSYQASGSEAESAKVDGQLEVDFVTGTGSAAREFKIAGRIAHATNAGLGIDVKSMPDGALQALLDHRASLYGSKTALQSRELDPVDARTLLAQCVDLYTPFLTTVLREFFALAQARGEELRTSMGTHAAWPYLAGLAELEAHAEEIRGAITEQVLQEVREVFDEKAAGAGAAQQDALNLIEDEEYEDWLNMAAVINKLESGLVLPLGYFEQLYGLLLPNAHDLDYEAIFYHGNLGMKNPFGPDTLGRAFYAALQGLRLDNAQRARFYGVLGEVLARHYPALFEKLNKLVAVLEPRLQRLQAARQRSVSAAQPGAGQGGGAPAPGGASAPSGAPGQAVTPGYAPAPGLEAKGYSLDRSLGALQEFGITFGGMGGAAQGQVGGAALLESSLFRAAGMLQQVVSQLSRHLPGLDASPAVPMPAVAFQDLPEASLNEVLLALDGVVQSRPGDHHEAWQPPLSEQLSTRLARVGGQAKRITPRQQQLLDSLTGVFDHALREYAPASELEALVRRFEVPFFKLALRDESFLTSPEHPGRQMLNLLDRFAIATDDSGKFFDPKLPDVLVMLIDNVLSRADQEPFIFAKACDTLEKMLQPLQRVRAQRIQRMQETSEGKSRILLARQRVITELEARLVGLAVPTILMQLLDAGWRHYLSLVELRQGMQDKAWQEGMEVLERIRSWLSPEYRPDKHHAGRVAALLGVVERCLATVSVEPARVGALIKDLDAQLSSRQDPEAPPVATVLLTPEKNAAAEDAALPEEGALAGQLLLGSWWNLGVERDKSAPMQLIWLSHPPASCVFANRSATRRKELTLAEMARLMEEGGISLATDKDMPLLDRSGSAIVDAAYQHLARQVSYDPVTKLINRKAFLQRLAEAAAMSETTEQPHALCVMEFDALQAIDHKYGVEAREDVLRHLADEIRSRLRDDMVLAASGDDSFVAYLPACDAIEARSVIQAALAWLREYRFHRGDDTFSIGSHSGVVEYIPGALAVEEVLRRADTACQQAKASGRNQVQIYASSDADLQTQEAMLEWVGRIDKILDSTSLYLRCQMVMPLHSESGLQSYYEILLGIREADGHEISPFPFIQAVERWNRVHEVDRWVISSVFAWIRDNPDLFAHIGGFSVNLSAQSLHNADMLAYLHEELSSGDLPLEKIMFEITESGAVTSYAAAQNFIREIKRYGCKFCIDDFGSGYASYGHLKNLRMDTIKIDGIFIKDMPQSASDYAMVKSMNEIGHSLGMHTVAEYVATPEILEMLKGVGVDYVQGYAIHMPEPLKALTARLSETAAAPDASDATQSA